MALFGAGAVSFLVAGVVAAGPATADKGGSSGAPPGNNATVKINNTDVEDNVNNEPHVNCPFDVSFYNFDKEGSSDTADVTFTAQPPSGNFQVVPVGAGSDPTHFTWDGSTVHKTYTFDQATLSTLTQQPQQGYHIKLTVDVTSTGASHGNGNANAHVATNGNSNNGNGNGNNGKANGAANGNNGNGNSNNANGNNGNGGNSGNNGNDHGKVTKKHKVFWLTCAPSNQPSSGSSSSSAPATVVSSSAPAVQPTQSQQQQPATHVSSSPAPKPSATVLGEKVTRKPVKKPPKAHVKATKVTKLPFTGVSSAMLGVYVPAALGFLFTGAGLIGLTRRTRMHPQV